VNDRAHLPHHDGSPLYVSTQTPELGDLVRVRIRIPRQFGRVDSVRVRSNPDHEPYFAVATPVQRKDGWTWWEAEVHVENPVHGYRWLINSSDGSLTWLNALGVSSTETLDSDDFKLVAHPAPPAWGSSSVMYQIFPDRFARSAAADDRELPEWAVPAQWGDEPVHIGPDTPHQFYGGDLQGIIDHLDHLERLGVTMIYLTPVFPARSNHRYDALSFAEVDPLLGGDEAFIELVRVAHERGFTVIGDLTSNHSGDAHEWFRASHQNPGTPESEFYYWKDAQQEEYVSWMGVPTLPKFNWNSGELRRRFIQGADSVVAKWLEPPYSLDGWRIDVANMTGRYLTDDLNAEVRQIIRQTMVDVNSDTILLGESTNDATGDFQGDGWHGAMTYANFTRPVWGWLSTPSQEKGPGTHWFFGLPYGRIPQYTGRDLLDAHLKFTAGLPWRVRLHTMNALDTHDTARFANRAMDGTVPVAVGMSMTLPGIPVVFMGDELGATGDDGEHSRTTMPWDTLDEHDARITLYSELIHLRTSHVALTEGGIRWLHADDDLLIYVREHADECVLVAATRAGFDLTLPRHSAPGEPLSLFGDATAMVDAAGLHLSGTGPSFNVWQLPGVTLHPFAEPGTILALLESPLPTTIGQTATRVLELAGVTTLEGVSAYTERELLDLHGVGPKAVRILREALDAEGLEFRP
jgi:alpha-glucosidase